ncbi:alpha/beta fold hydrolase [uncultured Brevundimonas sp.]|uniref:alpha/beta fold hydrolase n=1 Tax=uncultured Brevundimonas sp. TaxID=213418 RepID=UPI0030ED1563
MFGPRFNPDGVAALRFGHADFDVADASPKLDAIHVYPDTLGEDVTKSGSGAMMDDLRQRMRGKRSDTLVFIHGFNVTFNGALEAAALLARDVRVGDDPVNVMLFSWPSDGAAVPLMSYYSDREDARASGPAIARAFLKLQEYLVQLNADDYCQRCLHLLTHSMGAYVLRNALQAVRAKDPRALTRTFDQILLAAPDEDDDAFETDDKLRLLPRLGRQVTVYFNPNDKGLIISDRTKLNPDRLGSGGPRLIDLIPKKVVMVDCRRVAGHADPFIEHSYYIRSRAMSADIAAVLADTPPESIGNRTYVDSIRSWRIIAEPGLTPAADAR